MGEYENRDRDRGRGKNWSVGVMDYWVGGMARQLRDVMD